ncbi:hypothetical protein Rhal01_03459 [Rubritalea halochordaticola]|uniref:Uncharacterized protein n=1 Tax=Rubritalea halochordaticola TaxID=714537 RepID=A0ABP9V3N3_9BACT
MEAYVNQAFEVFESAYDFDISDQDLVVKSVGNFELKEAEEAIYNLCPEFVSEYFEDISKSWYFAYLSSYGRIFFLKGVLRACVDDLESNLEKCIIYLNDVVDDATLNASQALAILEIVRVFKAVKNINSEARPDLERLTKRLEEYDLRTSKNQINRCV